MIVAVCKNEFTITNTSIYTGSSIIHNDVSYFSLPLFLVRFCGFMVQLQSNARPVTMDYIVMFFVK